MALKMIENDISFVFGGVEAGIDLTENRFTQLPNQQNSRRKKIDNFGQK